MPPDDIRVVTVRKALDDATIERQRLNDLDTVRSAAWNSASTLLSSVTIYLRDGRPPNTTLEAVETPMPELRKGESLIDAVARLRHRRAEVAADLHRVKSSPYPSKYAKQRMREQIAARAVPPSISNLLEHNTDIEWPSMMVQQPVIGGKDGGLIGFDQVDFLGLLLWLQGSSAMQDAVVKALDHLIEAESDDQNAMTHEQRQISESEIMETALAIERDEAELVFAAQAQGLPCEHGSDIDVRVLLSLRLIAAPREVTGSTAGYSWEMRGPQRCTPKRDVRQRCLPWPMSRGAGGRFSVIPPLALLITEPRSSGHAALGGASGRHASLAQGVPPVLSRRSMAVLIGARAGMLMGTSRTPRVANHAIALLTVLSGVPERHDPDQRRRSGPAYQ